MALLGSDPDQLEAAAQTFRNKGSQTRAMAADLDGHLRATWWVGARSDEFRSYWFRSARPNMYRVAEALESNAAVLIRQAKEQRLASEGTGSATQSVGRSGPAGSIGSNFETTGLSRTGMVSGILGGAVGALIDIATSPESVGEVFLGLVEVSPKILGSFGQHLGPTTGFFKSMAYHSHTVASKVSPLLVAATAISVGIGEGHSRWLDDSFDSSIGGTERLLRTARAADFAASSVAVGAVGGAAIGTLVGGPVGAIVGGAVGGALGGAVAPFAADVGAAVGSMQYEVGANAVRAVSSVVDGASDLIGSVADGAAEAIQSAISLPKLSLF